MSWRCGWNDLRIMRWELTRTGGLDDIAFMVVDVVQRESLELIFIVECGPGLHQRMGIISARTCNADNGECFGK